MGFLEILLIFVTSFLISLGIELHSAINIINEIVKSGYRVNREKFNQMANTKELKKLKEKNIFIKICPFINIMFSIKVNLEVEHQINLISSVYKIHNVLDELSLAEQKYYELNPKKLVAILIQQKHIGAEEFLKALESLQSYEDINKLDISELAKEYKKNQRKKDYQQFKSYIQLYLKNNENIVDKQNYIKQTTERLSDTNNSNQKSYYELLKKNEQSESYFYNFVKNCQEFDEKVRKEYIFSKLTFLSEKENKILIYLITKMGYQELANEIAEIRLAVRLNNFEKFFNALENNQYDSYIKNASKDELESTMAFIINSDLLDRVKNHYLELLIYENFISDDTPKANVKTKK